VPSLHETAYPRLKASVTARDLTEVYTPTPEEVTLATLLTRSETARACFVLFLKTFQRLGYFVYVQEVPDTIVTHITAHLGVDLPVHERQAYDRSGTRRRHVSAIRDYLQITAYGLDAQAVLEQTLRDAAQTKEDLADLINVGIEELIRQRFELPGFTTLRRCAQRQRAAVNRELYLQVEDALGAAGRLQLEHLLTTDATTGQTLWTTIKADPGKPTLTQLRQLVARLQWLTAYNHGASALAMVPSVKVHHFAAEAHSLDATRMQRMPPAKRYTYAAALVQAQVAQTLDDLGEMFLKRMRSIHHHGEEALEDYRKRHQGRTDELITILYELLTAMHQDASTEDRFAAMSAVVGDQTDAILTDCLAYTAYANNNYYPLLWPFYTSHRQTLFTLLDQLPLRSTSQDTTVEDALAVLRTHRTTKRDWLDLSTTPFDLSWVSDKWWRLVTGTTVRTRTTHRVNRRHFEVCVFSQVMTELQSGDLCIPLDFGHLPRNQLAGKWQPHEGFIAAA
jgi:hypothetical protein